VIEKNLEHCFASISGPASLSLVHIGDKIDFDFVDRAVDCELTASRPYRRHSSHVTENKRENCSNVNMK